MLSISTTQSSCSLISQFPTLSSKNSNGGGTTIQLQQPQTLHHKKMNYGKASTSTAASDGNDGLPVKWLIVNDQIYDMTDFANVHPGGLDMIEEYLENDVTTIMSDAKFHKHSRNAFSMLDQYLIGKASDYLPNYKSSSTTNTKTQHVNDQVNYQKPLCHQVGMMGKNYFHWVHNTPPIYFKDSVTLFGSWLLEPLSHSPWYIVPLFWIPIIIYQLYLSTQIHTQLSIMIMGYLVGFLSWFVIEILFHKYLFHWDSLGKMGFYLTNIAHFLFHGFHHKVPMDKDRLVIPPVFMCLLASPVYFLARYVLPSYSHLLMAGGFTGYIFYDMHHYWLHHQTNVKLSLLNPISFYLNSEYWKTLKSHHFIHHFEEGGDNVNYGISNRIIDRLMGTLREEYAN